MPAPVTTIAGILGIEDAEITYVNTVGEQSIYDAIGEYTRALNAALDRLTGLFVQRTTTDHKFRYYLPGNRELQTQGGMARAAEQKTSRPYYDVALPIFQYGDAIGETYVDAAYMTVAAVDRQLAEMRLAARKRLRKSVLQALFNNGDLTYEDLVFGTLTIKPLANGDSVYYPPLPGYDDLATADHFAETGYATAAISDTNNPIAWHASKLQARYPDEVDGIVFIATNMSPYVKALTNFMEVGDPRIIKGGLADRLTNLPGAVPGRIIGRCDEMWVAEWADLPANYSFSIAPSAEKPLQKRIDMAGTGLPSELTLIKQSDLFPFSKSEWMWRYGMGVVNRLNGFVLECGVGGTYTVPTSLAY